MNKEDYKQSIKDEVRSVEVAGKRHFYKVPGYLDLDLFSIMKNDKLAQRKKMLLIMASVICNEDGVRVFNPDDDNDLTIIKSLPAETQLKLMQEITEAFFPGE